MERLGTGGPAHLFPGPLELKGVRMRGAGQRAADPGKSHGLFSAAAVRAGNAGDGDGGVDPHEIKDALRHTARYRLTHRAVRV